jgi:hypothetical protein
VAGGERRRAVELLRSLDTEDVPGPDVLDQQLGETYEFPLR